jgi:hypothetical protein
MYPHHLHTGRRFPKEVIACPRQDRQVVEIIILKEEITHDIEADITRLEKQRNLEKPILSGNESDAYTVRRQTDRALNQCVSRMQAYLLLPSPFVRHISTNHAGDWEEKNIFLAFPHNWPPHCIEPLRDAVHTYIVKSVEYNILLIAMTNDPYTAMCQQEADKAYNDINALINSRLGPMNIHPTFLG